MNTLLTATLALLAQTVAAPASAPAYVPERVYETGRRTFTDFEAMLADLAKGDVVVVGEQHEDPNTHRLELAILDGLRRRKIPLAVSLEMFERDVQDILDKYLSGAITEPEFLKAARPWPRYATDYRPLVELAKANGWPVIAANVPRRLAAIVAKSGRPAVDRLPEGDRRLAARDLECPRDDYFTRFGEAMSRHNDGADAKKQGAAKVDPPDAATVERYYWAQCLKDETMAESIAEAVGRTGPPRTVVHVTGAFHSDFGAGTVERIRRRLPGRRITLATILPVTDLDTVAPSGDDLRRAEFLVYTAK